MPKPAAVLDDLDLAVLQRRKSEKWHTYPPGVLPAWVAEMDFPVADPIRRVLQEAIDDWDVGYPVSPRGTGLPEVFAQRMSERFGWTVDPSRVEILSEVVQGLYLSLEAFAGKNEGAVVQTPIYAPFLRAVEETGRRLVENRLAVRGRDLEIDFDALRTGLDADTRVLLLCNPHNPSGRVFRRAELESLAELAIAHDLVVVSDEIHCDLVYDGREHVPFATVAPEVAARTVTLNSASKAFNIAGLRCAVAHFGSPELQRRFARVVPRHVRGGIGILGLYASIAAWRDSQDWLDAVVPYLQANRDYLQCFVAEHLPEVVCHAPQGTYLAWLDCAGLGIAGSPAAHFLRRGRLAVSDGRQFGAGFEQHVRINFATSRAILEQILERLATAARN